MKAAVVLPKRLIPDPLWLVSFRNINMNLPSHSGLYSSYPYNHNNPPTEMVNNPAYVTMEAGQIVRSQNDEGNVMDHDYATIGMEGDNTEASALSDEDTLQSTSEPSYI